MFVTDGDAKLGATVGEGLDSEVAIAGYSDTADEVIGEAARLLLGFAVAVRLGPR